LFYKRFIGHALKLVERNQTHPVSLQASLTNSSIVFNYTIITCGTTMKIGMTSFVVSKMYLFYKKIHRSFE